MGSAMIRDMRGENYVFSKWDAIQIVGSSWPKQGPLWIARWSVVKCWSRIGLTPHGVDFNSMDIARLHDDTVGNPASGSQRAVTEALVSSPRITARSQGMSTPTDNGRGPSGAPLKKGTAAWHAHRAKQWEAIALKNWQLAMSPVLPADAKMCDAHAAGTWHTAKPEHLKGTAGLTLDEAGAEAEDDDDHDAENANRHTGSLDASRALKQKRRQVSAEMTRLKSAVTKGSAKDKAWDLCGSACQCGKEECAIAKFQKCHLCGFIQLKKKTQPAGVPAGTILCGKAACHKALAEKLRLQKRGELLVAEQRARGRLAVASVAADAGATVQATRAGPVTEVSHLMARAMPTPVAPDVVATKESAATAAAAVSTCAKAAAATAETVATAATAAAMIVEDSARVAVADPQSAVQSFPNFGGIPNLRVEQSP